MAETMIEAPFYPCFVVLVCIGCSTQPTLEHNSRLLLDLPAVGGNKPFLQQFSSAIGE